MQRGIPNPTAGLRDEYLRQGHKVQLSLLRASKALTYWLDVGAVHRLPDGGFELVRPVPPLVIAGWVPHLFSSLGAPRDQIGIATLAPPPDPDWFPNPPDEVKPYMPRGGAPTGKRAQAQPVGQRLGPPRRVVAPEALRTEDALRVASYMLDNRVAHQPYASRGLRDDADQRLAVAISDHFLTHHRTYVRLDYGAAYTDPDGIRQWVRPVPGPAAAALLGIGPPDNPELTGWELGD
jgi:hypothetical protein